MTHLDPPQGVPHLHEEEYESILACNPMLEKLEGALTFSQREELAFTPAEIERLLGMRSRWRSRSARAPDTLPAAVAELERSHDLRGLSAL